MRRRENDEPLSPARHRELERRLRDLDDRARYLLASALSPTFVLYYDISSDTYVYKNPRDATLFKRRKSALAIKRLLGGSIVVVPCRVDARGRLVASSVRVPPSPRRRAAKKP